jgi:hypothetical protein
MKQLLRAIVMLIKIIPKAMMKMRCTVYEHEAEGHAEHARSHAKDAAKKHATKVLLQRNN